MAEPSDDLVAAMEDYAKRRARVRSQAARTSAAMFVGGLAGRDTQAILDRGMPRGDDIKPIRSMSAADAAAARNEILQSMVDVEEARAKLREAQGKTEAEKVKARNDAFEKYLKLVVDAETDRFAAGASLGSSANSALASALNVLKAPAAAEMTPLEKATIDRVKDALVTVSQGSGQSIDADTLDIIRNVFRSEGMRPEAKLQVMNLLDNMAVTRGMTLDDLLLNSGGEDLVAHVISARDLVAQVAEQQRADMFTNMASFKAELMKGAPRINWDDMITQAQAAVAAAEAGAISPVHEKIMDKAQEAVARIDDPDGFPAEGEEPDLSAFADGLQKLEESQQQTWNPTTRAVKDDILSSATFKRFQSDTGIMDNELAFKRLREVIAEKGAAQKAQSREAMERHRQAAAMQREQAPQPAKPAEVRKDFKVRKKAKEDIATQLTTGVTPTQASPKSVREGSTLEKL